MQGKKIIVIGAGASGLMAAIAAAEHGAEVLVLEHMSSAGRKLLLTGNGRCNYTNTDIGPQHYYSLGEVPADSFMQVVLHAFTYDDCILFFRQLGIDPEIRHYRFDDTGYVYPSAGGSSEGFKALTARAEELGIQFSFESMLRSIVLSENGTRTVGWHRRNGGHTEYCEGCYDAMILATGSNAYPQTGSDSSIYPFLKELGLEKSFTGFYPALCALYSKDPLLSELHGKRLDGCVSVASDDGTIRREAGEIQFNAHSISGIPVMQLSRYVSAALRGSDTADLKIMIPGADPEKPALDHVFPIHRTAGFERAQCCTGGIRTDAVDPHTMRFLFSPGIYLCGELLDIDGDCGGYNLHFAWATGRIAGRNAAL